MASQESLKESAWARLEELRPSLEEHAQGHLLQFAAALGEAERGALADELASLDVGKIVKIFKASMAGGAGESKKDDRLEPLEPSICGSTLRDESRVAGWEEAGLEEIGRGKVAALLLAGGQGTRLGVSYPKGMYDVGLPSGKSLYQLQAERILKLQQLARERSGADCIIPWYIMTSEHTKRCTIDYFKENKYFGLDPSDVVVFEQGTLPCLDFDGRVILADRHKLSRAPDGNGGLYLALKKGCVLEDMKRRGIEYIHVYCVDNILVKMADPVFIGFCKEKGAECGAKVVQKAFETEPVGVFCLCDSKYQVVEYSEITQETARKRNPDGSLTFSAANICNHFFTWDFLDRVIRCHLDDLQHHVARKKIPCVDASGKIVKPDKNNGIKMEKFVFDVFQFAQTFAVLEVNREDEFSPLKNKPGAAKDCPKTARAALLDLHYRQVLSAGGSFVDTEGKPLPLIPRKSVSSSNPDSPSGDAAYECEVSPLVSYFGEGLAKFVKGKEFCAPQHFEVSNPHIQSVLNGIGSENGGKNGQDTPKLKKAKV